MTSEISTEMKHLNMPEDMGEIRNSQFHRAFFCLFDDEGEPSLCIEIKALDGCDGIRGYLDKEDILDLIAYLNSRLKHMEIE